MGYRWNDVKEWVEDYSGDCSGVVKYYLKEALSGNNNAWFNLEKLYLAYQKGVERGRTSKRI